MTIERTEGRRADLDVHLEFRDVAEALPAMVGVSDLDGRLVYVNQRWLDYTGLDLPALNADRRRFIHPDDYERVIETRERAVRSDSPFDVDYRVRRYDGVYRWHSWRALPMRDERGYVVRWIGTTTDIDDRRQMEDALRQGEREFRHVFEATSEGIFKLDAHARTVYVNARMAEMLGYTPEDMAGRSLFEFVDEDGAAIAGRQFARRREGHSDQFDFRFRHRNGSDVWVIVNATPTYASDGSFSGSFAMITDVTARRRAQDALIASEARYRSLADLTPALVTVSDSSGKINYCNRHLLEYSGLTSDEISGGAWSSVFHPDDYSAHFDEWADALRTGRPTEGEFRARRFDGVYRWHLGRMAPVHDGDGNLVMWIGVHIDIDDRKRAELTQAMFARLGDMLNATLDYEHTIEGALQCVVPDFADYAAVHMLEDDRQLRRTAFAGIDDEALRLDDCEPNPHSSRGVPGVVRTGVAELHEQVTDDLLQELASTPDQLAQLRAAGVRSAIVVPIPSRMGITGAMWFSTSRSGRVYGPGELQLAREIARRAGLAIENARLYGDAQRTLDELRRANAAKDEFLGLVSHELKTPITTIYGNAEVLMRQSAHLDAETRQAAIADMASEAERLHRIIDNLLVLARLERGQTISSEPILIHRLAERLIDEHRRRFPFRRIELNDGYDETPIFGEPLYVDQVLRNLIGNAEKYSPWDRRIDVEIVSERGMVRVSVLDRGPGIDAGEADRIFTPFYRSHRTSTRAGGVGIGLAVCKRLIEALGGYVWARPRDEGGSDIGFALPAASDEES